MTHNPSPQPYNNQQFGYEADFNDSKVSFDNILIWLRKYAFTSLFFRIYRYTVKFSSFTQVFLSII